MNKRGQTLGLAILSFIGILIVGFMLINFLLPSVTDFRTDLNCADASAISDGSKVLCLVGGLAVPLFIVAILSVAIGAITKRFIFR